MELSFFLNLCISVDECWTEKEIVTQAFELQRFQSQEKFLEGINKYNSRFCLALAITWKKTQPFSLGMYFLWTTWAGKATERLQWMYLLCYRKIKLVCGSFWCSVFWVSREWIPFSVNNVLVTSAWWQAEVMLELSAAHHTCWVAPLLPSQHNRYWGNAGGAAPLENYFFPFCYVQPEHLRPHLVGQCLTFLSSSPFLIYSGSFE